MHLLALFAMGGRLIHGLNYKFAVAFNVFFQQLTIELKQKKCGKKNVSVNLHSLQLCNYGMFYNTIDCHKKMFL